MKSKHIQRIYYLLNADQETRVFYMAAGNLMAKRLLEEIGDEEFNNKLQKAESAILKRMVRAPRKQRIRKTKRGKQYESYINSAEWGRKKKECFELKGKLCQLCGSLEKLHVHHATYKNFKNEDVENDLYILCSMCHDEYHKIYSASKTTIQKTRDFIGLDHVFKK